jgi:hypothetical protein
MHKKLMTACMALVAFAALAVMPAVASATNDPDVTYPTGTLLAAGSTLKATNVGETLMTDTSGNVLTRCTAATMTGTLTKNNGTEVEGNVSSATFSGTGSEGRCTATFGNSTVDPKPATNGLPWCLRSTPAMATDEMQLRGNECSKAARPIRFLLNTSVGECAYERASAVVGTYTTDLSGQDATVTVTKQLFSAVAGTNGFFCPAEGLLDMTFTLERDTETAEPLFVS